MYQQRPHIKVSQNLIRVDHRIIDQHLILCQLSRKQTVAEQPATHRPYPYILITVFHHRVSIRYFISVLHPRAEVDALSGMFVHLRHTRPRRTQP